jgi:hypothetical protein
MSDHQGNTRTTSPDIQAASDHAILAVSEVLALLFALPFGDDLYHDRPMNWLHTLYLAVGILFAIGGPIWPAVRTRLPPAMSASFARAALGHLEK